MLETSKTIHLRPGGNDGILNDFAPTLAALLALSGLGGVTQRTPMDEVLEISLREEEIHSKLSETEAAISSLEELLQKTQAQLNKRKYMKRKVHSTDASLSYYYY